MIDMSGIQLPFNVNDLMQTSNGLLKVFAPYILLGVILNIQFFIQLFFTKVLLLDKQETKKTTTRKRNTRKKSSTTRKKSTTATNSNTTKRSTPTNSSTRTRKSNLKVV